MYKSELFTPPAFPADIDKEQMALLPRAKFRGNIVLVDTIEGQEEVIRLLMREEVVGMDTETKPNFVPGKRVAVSLLQIATREVCYLFRLHLIGIQPALKTFLEDPRILKIGLSLRDDLSALRRVEPFCPGGFVELQQIAPAYGLMCASLQKLYAIVLGRYMSKAQRMTNWEGKQLTEAQQAYAALDAQASLEIYLKLMEQPAPQPTQFGLVYL